ncbi:MAG: sulfotransferase [Tepidisphaeraceae bacterium]|jgi:Flp pilus assembly protein TadD
MLPKALHEARAGQEQFSRGRWAEAREHFLEAIRLEPNRADCHLAAARCQWLSGQVEKAGEYLQAAVRLDPGLAAAQAWLGEWYMSQGIIDAALQASAVAMELAPDDPAFMQSRAWVLAVAGELDAAWELTRKLVSSVQMTPSLARLYGLLAGRYGQQSQALEAINRLLGAGLALDESPLYFTAAALLDRAGRCDEAFAMAVRGNACRPGPRYDPAGQERWINCLIEYFTRQRIRSLPKATLRSDKPVFIVGMPRTGTSLVEQILASHPSVHGAGELDFLYRLLLGTVDMLGAQFSAFPACLDNLATAQVDGMAHVYLGPFIAFRPDAVRIIDKMPLNFLHLGLIALFFPGARIIHCRRDPMDTCLSCFLTHFNRGNEFKHSLAHLGHFYRLYERLMAHWRSVIDLPVLEVSYEEVVAEPEAQSRRMVEFLGLPWDDRCRNFHEVTRPCATASVMQVRRPVYDTSVRRWKNYEKHLAPLVAALQGSQRVIPSFPKRQLQTAA